MSHFERFGRDCHRVFGLKGRQTAKRIRAAGLATDSPFSTLVCYEKFERIETSQFQNCFTKHDFLYRESIEITTSIS